MLMIPMSVRNMAEPTTASKRSFEDFMEPSQVKSNAASLKNKPQMSSTEAEPYRRLVQMVTKTPSPVNLARSSRKPTLDTMLLPKQFSSQASIVLVGGRGTGKSTLAVIASVSFQRRHIDVYQYFKQKSGITMADARVEWNASDYESREARILQSLLSNHSTGCVIVWPSGCTETSRQLLRHFAVTHPVVHVVRDSTSVRNYLKLWAGENPGRRVDASNIDYRFCSNFEFYNLSEGTIASNSTESGKEKLTSRSTHYSESRFLKLKRVEQEFLHFLKAILSNDTYLPIYEHRQPLALISRSAYTYSLSVALSQMETNDDLEDVLHCGADVFELRVDVRPNTKFDASRAESISQKFAYLRRFFPGPIIYHIEAETRHAESGTETAWSFSADEEAAYLELIYHGLRLCPEYLTIDLHWTPDMINKVCAAKGATKIIGHYHDPSPGRDGWSSSKRRALYHKARSLRCDMVRLTQPALNMEDNAAAQAFIYCMKSASEPHVGLIAYNTGRLGRPSCVMNRIFTPITTSSLLTESDDYGHDTLSPRLTLRDAQNSLFSSFIFDPLRFYIFGTDVSYSLSPAMHNAAYQHFGMPHHFCIKNITSVDEIWNCTKDPTFGGASIAQGPRTAVIPLLHTMSRHARAIGAVNTLIPIRNLWDPTNQAPAEFWQERNRAGPVQGLYGDNTDWVGMRECILQKLSPVNAVRSQTTSLVIGAGGMARGAIYALMTLGLEHIFLVNRTIENAQKLADHFNKLEIDSQGHYRINTQRRGSPSNDRVMVIRSLEERWPQGYAQPTIVVCCVPPPVNKGPSEQDILLPSGWIKSPTGGVVVDLAYNPSFNTALLRQMRGEAHRGWVTADGLDVLPEQGAAQFELLTGRKVPPRIMRIEALRNYKIDEDADNEARESIALRLRYLQRKGEQLENYF